MMASFIIAIRGSVAQAILLGLCAALLYCAIVLLNRGVKDLPATETTLCQLTVSALVMLPYVLLTQKGAALDFSGRTLLLVLLLGFVHTGLAYLLFFGAAAKLPAARWILPASMWWARKARSCLCRAPPAPSFRTAAGPVDLPRCSICAVR